MRLNTSSCLMLRRFIVIISLVQYLNHFRVHRDPSSPPFLHVVGQTVHDSSSNTQSSSVPPAFEGKSSDLVGSLNELSDKELEHICTSRGFELVKESDKETGQPITYSHQDYVDAAKQCLEIEAEMERILKENPNLLEEMELESRRMMEEKSTLEEKLKQTQNLLDEKKKTTNREEPTDDNPRPREGQPKSSKNNDTTTGDEGSPSWATHEMDESSKLNEPGTTRSSSSIRQEDDELEFYNCDDSDVLDLDQLDTTISEEKEKKTVRDTRTLFDTSDAGKMKDVDDDDLLLQDDDSISSTTSSSLVEKAHSCMLSIIDTVNEYKMKLMVELERIYIQYLPDHVRKQLTEILKPIHVILQSTLQSIQSMVKRYSIVILQGVKKQIDTTLVGLTNDTNKR